MQYVYLLSAKTHGTTIAKIGKTTRSPKQRLAEINKSWAVRGVKWRIVKVMTVFDCTGKETALHRQYRDCRYTSAEVSQWLGGRCDGDSEIFQLDRRQRKELLYHMGAFSWAFSWETWAMLGIGAGLCLGAWVWRSQAPTVERVRSVMEIPR